LYFYYLDRHFGFMHVRLSTWMPFSIQVYVNVHDWLARQLAAKGISFQQVENSFVNIQECDRAHAMANRLPTLPWEKILHAFVRRVNPLLKKIQQDMEYYWVNGIPGHRSLHAYLGPPRALGPVFRVGRPSPSI
jgi:hypothetical protein